MIELDECACAVIKGRPPKSGAKVGHPEPYRDARQAA